jgi:hypothetical protein
MHARRTGDAPRSSLRAAAREGLDHGKAFTPPFAVSYRLPRTPQMHESRPRSWARSKTYIVAPLVILGSVLASGTLLAGSSPAAAGVKGKVSGWEKLLPQAYTEAANDSRRYTWRESSPSTKPDFEKLSANVSRDVCVVALGTGAAQAHEPLAVKLTGGRFTPGTIVLSPGSRLSFKNVDPFPHVLFEVGNGTWAANPTAPGSSREWAATAPGLHVIRDQLFPSVVMYVLVDPNAVEFAFPDHEGAFTMAVTPGDYTFKAFFEGKPVTKGGDAVHVGPGGFELRDPLAVGAESK